MRNYVAAFFALLILAGAGAYAAQGPTIVTPGQEKYTKQPGNYQMAVLYGDPSKAGFWVVRLKTPGGWTFPVHYHSGRESVTVISGTFYAAVGSKFDAKKLMAFPAGSFISLPPKLPHYAMTKDPAVIDISGTEPLTNVMVKK